jgi:hypothetical protein
MGQAPLDGQTILSSQKITLLSRLKYIKIVMTGFLQDFLKNIK